MESDWDDLHKYAGQPLYGVDVYNGNIVKGEWEVFESSGELAIRWDNKIMFTYVWAPTFAKAKELLVAEKKRSYSDAMHLSLRLLKELNAARRLTE